MKSILDPTFRYTPSTHTDIAKTFARIRHERSPTMRIMLEPEARSGRTLSLVARFPSRNTR